MNEFSYGQTVDFSQVLQTEKSMQVFIPQKFPWERETGMEAEIVLNKDFRIRATEDSKLLIQTEKRIKEMDIPFSGGQQKKTCDLRTFLKEKHISFEEADGNYCDGTKWNQKESTDRVCYCKKGMISMCSGPYWGIQYAFHFAEEKTEPTAGGRPVRILRFSYCKENMWLQAEKQFLYLAKKKRILDFKDLYLMGTELNNRAGNVNACRVYLKKESGEYDWYDLSSVL